MEAVETDEAVRNWLRRERRKPYREGAVRGSGDDWELVGRLFCQCPFQASFLWRYPVEWYRTELTESEFRRLRVIEGPADESWRALSPDDTILGAAKRIRTEGLTGVRDGIDIDFIRRRATELGDDAEAECLTLFLAPEAETPSVADGNHYATAKMLSLLDGAPYVPQPAYLAVVSPAGPADASAAPDAAGARDATDDRSAR
jgi:hypothetical protein